MKPDSGHIHPGPGCCSRLIVCGYYCCLLPRGTREGSLSFMPFSLARCSPVTSGSPQLGPLKYLQPATNHGSGFSLLLLFLATTPSTLPVARSQMKRYHITCNIYQESNDQDRALGPCFHVSEEVTPWQLLSGLFVPVGTELMLQNPSPSARSQAHYQLVIAPKASQRSEDICRDKG